MIVADTSLIATLLLATPNTPMAESVFALDSEWLAPPLWRYELKNVLARQIRVLGLPVDDAICLFSTADSIIGSPGQEADAASVLRLADRTALSAYDSEFLAQALLIGVPLITFDAKVLKASPGVAFSPEEFLRKSHP